MTEKKEGEDEEEKKDGSNGYSVLEKYLDITQMTKLRDIVKLFETLHGD